MDIDSILGKHQELVFKQKGQAKMILAYHTVGNGITFGGIRLIPKAESGTALKDALRLSQAMTCKLSLINEPYGGSKAVVIAPDTGKTKQFLHDIGLLVEEEHGKFITAIDFGFEPDDAKIIREKTTYILAVKDSVFGQSGVTTALGVFEGIKTTLHTYFGSGDIPGRSFAVQGLGSVGRVLADKLIEAGGDVSVSDINSSLLEGYSGKCKIVSHEKILFTKADVLCPCGPAYILNKNTIPYLQCAIIAGGANCQLEDEVLDDKILHDMGILIAPDFAINAGGVIQGIAEFCSHTISSAIARLGRISENLNQIYGRAHQKNIGPYCAAKEITSKN